jgi:hypothetical protein
LGGGAVLHAHNGFQNVDLIDGIGCGLEDKAVSVIDELFGNVE